MTSWLNMDQAALDEWHDDGARVFNALAVLGINEAVVTDTDGSVRLVVRRDEHGDPVRSDRADPTDSEMAM
jgi:hypothetical protein